MSRPKRTKPAKPRDLSAEERHTLAERRAARREMEGRGITVHVDPRNEEITGAQRLDCFAMLLRGRPEEQAAVQWFEALIRTAQGENTPERRPDFIRGSVEGAPGQGITQAMVEAGRELVAATEAMAPQMARMLFELMRPDAAILGRWHAVVERCTGERSPHARGAVVRAACAHLVWVRANIGRLVSDRQERRAAA